MTDLIKIDFYGDELLAHQDEAGEVHVALRRMCENLGLDPKSQHEKLKRSAWACVVLITTHDTTGRSQQMSMLPLRAVPMWLAGIDVERVGAHVREKLIRYQLEAAEVLARHFMPKAAPAPAVDLRSMLGSREGMALILAETAQVLEEERAKRMETEARCLLLSADLRAAETLIEESADAVAFVDVVRQTDDEWTSYEAAQILQQKPKAFVQWMINEKILFKRDDRIQVYTQYRPKYARIRFSKPFINAKTGKEETSETVVFNRSGIEWLAKKLNVSPQWPVEVAS